MEFIVHLISLNRIENIIKTKRNHIKCMLLFVQSTSWLLYMRFRGAPVGWWTFAGAGCADRYPKSENHRLWFFPRAQPAGTGRRSGSFYRPQSAQRCQPTHRKGNGIISPYLVLYVCSWNTIIISIWDFQKLCLFQKFTALVVFIMYL